MNLTLACWARSFFSASYKKIDFGLLRELCTLENNLQIVILFDITLDQRSNIFEYQNYIIFQVRRVCTIT